MALIHIENHVDPVAFAKVLRQEKQHTAIECLRIIRRGYGDFNMFALDNSVQQIAKFYEINLHTI